MNTANPAPIAYVTSYGHAHAADLEAFLDFVNSESYDDGVAREHLPTVDDAVAYFTLRGLAHEDALRAQAARDGAWLSRLHAVRAGLREVWDAEVEHRIPDQAALDTVNAVLREAPRIELVAGGDCCGVGHRHAADDPTGEALARICRAVRGRDRANETGRFRICASDGCRWVFEDTSAAGGVDGATCPRAATARRSAASLPSRGHAAHAGVGGTSATLTRLWSAPSSSGRTSVANRVIDSSS
jgi:predicted RNA-binding Zn ribbon-like protein